MTPLVRKLAIALAVSVALNLFALGFVVARGLGHHGPHDHPPHMGELHGRRMRGGHGFGLHGSELGDEQRAAMKTHRRAIADAQRAVSAALAAEPYDPAALQAALQTLRARQAAAAEAAHGAMAELAGRLDAAGRRALAERAPGMHRR